MKKTLETLFGKPDYTHIARDITIEINLSMEEVAAVLYAYDRGLDELDTQNRKELDKIFAKLKTEIHP